MGKSSNKKTKRKSKQNIDIDAENKPIAEENCEEKKTYTVDQLLSKAEDLIDSFEFEAAGKFCEKAVEKEPDNVRCIETMALMLMECAHLDEAKNKFQRAIDLQPDNGHSKYMNIGQLCTGLEAIGHFKKGLEIMNKQIKTDQSNQRKPVTTRDISNGYCSIAEIYMTDACFEEGAQSECCQNLLNALASDDTNADGLLLSASFYLTIGDTEQAELHINKSIDLWLPEMRQGRSTGGASSSDHIYVCSQSYLSRINATKILIELDLLDKAVEILELLLDEEDEILDVWYLLGMVHCSMKEPASKESARFYLDKGLELVNKLENPDKEVINHMKELREKLGDAEPDEPIEEDAGEEDEQESSDEEMEY